MTDNLNFFEEKELSSTSLNDLQILVRDCFNKRKEYDDAKDAAKKVGEELDALEAKILSILEAHNLPNFTVAGAGTVYKTTKYSVSMPKDAENAAKLRQFLIDTGLESYLTVNHNSLNGLYKSKVEEAQSQGLPIDGLLPGVSEPTPYTTIGLRKGK